MTIRARREPPRYRLVEVGAVAHLGPRMMRVTLRGQELAGLEVEDPAASVRLLLPSPGADELVMPEWNGNEFLLPDGRRPTIRTFTPRHVRPDELELDLDIVVHGGGRASDWAASAPEGARAAVSGPGRGYAIAEDAPAYLLAGDETAIPAMSQLLESLPSTMPVEVHVEIGHPDGRIDLPGHPRATVSWHALPTGSTPGAAMFEAVAAADLVDGARVWAAGEAAAVQRIRRHLFDDRGLARTQTAVRGYWKHGRSADTDEG